MRAWTAALLPMILFAGAADVHGQVWQRAAPFPQPSAANAQRRQSAQPVEARARTQVQSHQRRHDGFGSIDQRRGLRGAGPHHHGHAHQPFRYGPSYGLGYGGYGYGGLGYYGGYSLGIPGYGFNQYVGPANFGPLINPPVYAFPNYDYGFGYGVNYGYSPAFGYGTAYGTVTPSPLNNQLLQEAYNNDWARLSAEMAERATRNVIDPAQAAPAVRIPSSPEAKIKSLRYQSQGDEAFRNQEFNRAFDRYRLASLTAKDNGAAWLRAGYALVALGRYSSAAEHFKRALAADPSIAVTGPAPEELYGDNLLAWNSHLGRATLWVREDVRDPERVFLLGTLLYFNGDSRASEFLEKAYQLSGGREHAVLTLLNPPKIINEVAEGAAPAEETPSEPDLETLLDEPVEGPALGSPPDGGDDQDREETAVPPRVDEETAPSQPSASPYGRTPLFPLPSEQSRDREDDESTIPPLPAPEEE